MRLANIAPAYCSSCHLHPTDAVFVDFEAYWDGPTLNGSRETGTVVVAIDDLIICEECLTTAATLIGMIHHKGMIKENYELGQAIEEKDAYINVLEKAFSDLENALGLVLVGKIKRGKGRPAIRIPDNVDQLVKERLQEANS